MNIGIPKQYQVIPIPFGQNALQPPKLIKKLKNLIFEVAVQNRAGPEAYISD